MTFKRPMLDSVSVGFLAGVLAVSISMTGAFPERGVAQDLEDEEGPLPTVKITPGRVKAFQAAVLRFHETGPPVGADRVEALREETERGLAFSSVGPAAQSRGLPRERAESEAHGRSAARLRLVAAEWGRRGGAG